MFRKTIILLLIVALVASLASPCVLAASLDLRGRVVILDAGHAASTTNKYQGYDEQATMLKLAGKIKPVLEARGATVYLTRTSDADVLLAVRAAKINIWSLEVLRFARQRQSAQQDGAADDIAEIDRLIGIMQSVVNEPGKNAGIYINTPFSGERVIHPDLQSIFELQEDPEVGNRFLVISLHSNATGTPINTSANGASAFTVSNSNSSTSTYYSEYTYEMQSRRFADILLDNIASIGIRKRNVTSANFFMIREHNVPGVLIENGFHTNDDDRANLMSDSFLDSLAYAYLNSISAYFDELPFAAGTPMPLYNDVKYSAWYYPAVIYVSETGLFMGIGNNKFSPDSAMTRAMLTTVLARWSGDDFSDYNESPYADVDIGEWYGQTVAWAVDNGILGYISGDLFEPEQYISREEIALMLYNYFIWNGYTLPVIMDIVFEDEDDISPWARIAVDAIRDYGIMRGDNNGMFNPRDNATRAEVSQIFFNMMTILANTE